MNLLKRIVVAVLFIPLILFCSYKGSWYLFSFLTALTFLGLYEFRNLLKAKGEDVNFFLPVIGILLFKVSVDYGVLGFSYGLFASLFLLFFIDLLNNKLDGTILRVSSSLFSLIYVSGSFSMIYVMTMGGSKYLLPALIILIWITDSFAYFIGMTLGKHRGMLKVSPKKSIEGFVAGIAFPIISGLVFYHFKKDIFSLKEIIMLSISAGIFGQLGDLFESALKRDAGVKDSSNLIPGHGGILDRFDSLLIAGPSYMVLSFFINEIIQIIK